MKNAKTKPGKVSYYKMSMSLYPTCVCPVTYLAKIGFIGNTLYITPEVQQRINYLVKLNPNSEHIYCKKRGE